MSESLPEAVAADRLTLSYGSGNATRAVVEQASFWVGGGELVAVAGPSGSGKTTLLLAIAGLQPQAAGTLRLFDRDSGEFSGPDWRRLRSTDLRVCFQQPLLLPYLSAGQNATLAINGTGRERLETLKDRLGLAGLWSRRPRRLSAGEQQRVALVRALATDPTLLLADEPTAALDDELTMAVGRLLRERCATGKSTLIAAHDHALLDFADRIYRIEEKRIVQVG